MNYDHQFCMPTELLILMINLINTASFPLRVIFGENTTSTLTPQSFYAKFQYLF